MTDRKTSVQISVLVLIAYIASTFGYSYFGDRLPNGGNVPNPCSANSKWKGFGHINEAGGGSRNSFGIAFASAGFMWTPSLCQADSDGDGKTNGEELGDPNCVWTAGTIPARTNDISHPGVCEPINSVLCKSKNEQIFGTTFCANHAFDCPAINASDVIPVDFKITNTSVPTQETIYMCQAFNVNMSTTHHMIAMTPLIDNANIMHHIIVYGCVTKPDDALFLQPRQCLMASNNCRDILALWALGVKGDCFNDQLGVSMGGDNGFQYVVLEFHWNNPQLLTTYFDSSGVRLYMTPNLRPNEGAIIMAGPRYLEIPPGRESVFQNMTCSSGCTKRLLTMNSPDINHRVYLTFTTLHMHYNGRYGSVEQWRNGSKVVDLVPYQQIRYDDPEIFMHKPAQIMEPGDELRISCNYNSIGKTYTIYWGESTQNEMCFAFIRYYPKLLNNESFDCLTYGDVDLCLTMTEVYNVGQCNLMYFYAAIYSNVLADVLNFCDIRLDICHPLCKTYTRSLLQHPCMTGWPRKYLGLMTGDSSNDFALKFTQIRLAIARCEIELASESNATTNNNTTSTQTTAYAASTESMPVNQLALLIAGAVASFALVLVVALYGLVRAMLFTNSNEKKHFYQVNEPQFVKTVTTSTEPHTVYEETSNASVG